MSKTRPYGTDRCLNCGEYGSHYCGPSFGDRGFFICKKKVKSEPEVEKDKERPFPQLQTFGGITCEATNIINQGE